MSTTKADSVHWVEERELGDEALNYERRSSSVAPQDWDVTDPKARDIAAKEQGLVGSHYDQHAMWFINSDDNAAALVVFRRVPPQRTGVGEGPKP